MRRALNSFIKGGSNIISVSQMDEFAFKEVMAAALQATLCIPIAASSDKTDAISLKLVSFLRAENFHICSRLFGLSLRSSAVISLLTNNKRTLYCGFFTVKISVKNGAGFLCLRYCGYGNVRPVVCSIADCKHTFNGSSES